MYYRAHPDPRAEDDKAQRTLVTSSTKEMLDKGFYEDVDEQDTEDEQDAEDEQDIKNEQDSEDEQDSPKKGRKAIYSIKRYQIMLYYRPIPYAPTLSYMKAPTSTRQLPI